LGNKWKDKRRTWTMERSAGLTGFSWLLSPFRW
jgi:hypothetical protein